VLVPELEPAHPDANLLEEGFGAQVVHAPGHVDAALATLGKSVTVEGAFDSRIELNAVRHGNLAKVGSLGALNGLFFAGKGNGRHADSWLSMVEVDGLF
jgi:hypothetical protein